MVPGQHPFITAAKVLCLIEHQPEFAHPYYVLSPHVDITVASPAGGKAPLDANSVEYFKDDPESVSFLQDKTHLWNNTEKLSDLVGSAEKYDAVFFVGGHGRAYPTLTHHPPPLQTADPPQQCSTSPTSPPPTL